MVNKYTKVMESSNPSATFLELPVIDTYHQKSSEDEFNRRFRLQAYLVSQILQ